MADVERKLANGADRIDFQGDPSRYRHWKLSIEDSPAGQPLPRARGDLAFEGASFAYQAGELVLLELDQRSLPSYIELRPSKPPKK